MKASRILIDITDPNNVFVHKGGGRKGHTYVWFKVKVSKGEKTHYVIPRRRSI